MEGGMSKRRQGAAVCAAHTNMRRKAVSRTQSMVISSLLAPPLWLAQEETLSSFQEGVLSMIDGVLNVK
jgi:hypothetical protein